MLEQMGVVTTMPAECKNLSRNGGENIGSNYAPDSFMLITILGYVGGKY